MKNIIQLLLLLGLVAISTGCATPYMVDRGRDAADVFTATVGVGAGAKARVGPISVGALFNKDVTGLRGGSFFANWDNFDFLIPYIPLDPETWFVGGFEQFMVDDVTEDRGKEIASATGYILFSVGDGAEYYSQIEAVLGLGPSIRLGFNPGELLDFILGWTTIDIYNDDIERKKSNKILEDTGTSAPDPQD